MKARSTSAPLLSFVTARANPRFECLGARRIEFNCPAQRLDGLGVLSRPKEMGKS